MVRGGAFWAVGMLFAASPAAVGDGARVGWRDDGSSAEGWTDGVWPGTTGLAAIASDGQRITFTTLNGSFMTGASAVSAPTWPDWDRDVAFGLAMIVKRYPRTVDLDRYPYLVARMTHAGTFMALALNGTDTKVCYTTGTHAVDLRHLAQPRLRGRQPIELRLTFLNTEGRVVLDEVRLVSALTPEERAGLIPAGFDLRLERLEPRPYHGLEALNARCGRPVRFGVPNEGATFRDSSTQATVRRLTGSPRNEFCDTFSPTGSALPIYGRAPNSGSLYDFAAGRPRDLTGVRGATVFSRERPSTLYALSSAADGAQARYTVEAYDFVSGQRSPVAAWTSADGGHSEFGLSPFSEVLILGLKEARALYLIDPRRPPGERVRRVPLPMRMKGAYPSHDDQRINWQRCYYFQRWQMDLASGKIEPAAYPTYGGHEIFGRDRIVGRYGSMLLSHRLGLLPLEEATAGEVGIFANWAAEVPSDYGALAPDDRWLVTNGTDGAVAGKRLLVDGQESGTVLQVVHDFTSRNSWDANTYSRISPDATKIAYNGDMLGDTDVYLAYCRRPRPPRNLVAEPTAEGLRLSWRPPDSALELRGYNVYRSERSGRGYARLNRERVAGTTFLDPAPPATAVYAVVAEEHSGLEGLYSEEVAVGRPDSWRVAAEVEEGALTPPLRQLFDGRCANFRAVRVWRETPDEVTGSARLEVTIPAGGDYGAWLRTRGAGALTLGGGAATVAHRVDSVDWTWSRCPVPMALAAGRQTLVLASETDGLCLDRLVLTSDPDDRPTALDDRDRMPDAVGGLVAEVGSDSVHLRWTPSAAPDVAEYSVYVGERPDVALDNATLLGSGPDPEALDWGLKPGGTLFYQVVATTRRGLSSPPASVRAEVPAAPTATLSLPIAEAELSGGLRLAESRGVQAAWLPEPAGDGQRPAATWRIFAPHDGRYYVWMRYATYDQATVALFYPDCSGDAALAGTNWRLRQPGTLTRHLNGVVPGEETWFSDKMLTGWWAGPIDAVQLARGEHTFTVGFDPAQAPRGPRLAEVYLSSDPSYRPPGYDPRVDFVK